MRLNCSHLIVPDDEPEDHEVFQKRLDQPQFVLDSRIEASSSSNSSGSGSLLYRIPQEIRDEIFRYFFSSTPVEVVTRPAYEHGRPPPSLLACCRRMR
ncbi:hypothetical protein PG985_008541 [Apiospora marii]|uniref:F-box domain-containing protein n=1 Tax=Apiospora marii TaxID=335849 RepID=A0ABR1R3N8_9PEZI